VAGAEPGQALLGVARPGERQAPHAGVARRGGELEHQVAGGGLGDDDPRLDVQWVAERLLGDHALRELDELVLDLAVAHARRDRPDEPVAAAAHRQPERGPRDLDGGHRRRVPHRGGDSGAASQDGHRLMTRWSRSCCKSSRTYVT
jgi:hypothetical protein